jgi:hypothetical protein
LSVDALLFPAVSLEALVARAALQERTDRKYLVDRDTCARLTEELAGDHLALEIAGRRRFHYETIYFDTPAFDCYRDHVQGRRRRFKCRTRLYADSGLCVFELKLKDGRGRTLKRTLALKASEHGRLTDGMREFLERELLAAYGRPAPDVLIPVLRTSFSRLTLVARNRPERLTCDFGLTVAAEGTERHLCPRTVLVETKTERGSGVADRCLRALGARPLERLSKFCLGMALTRADVRDNVFRSLLKRHFPASLSPIGGRA